MNIKKIIRLLPGMGGHAAPPPADDREPLLMDDYGNIRLNYNNPEVQKNILHQLKTYRNLPTGTRRG